MDVRATEQPVPSIPDEGTKLERSVAVSLAGKAVEVVTLVVLSTVIPRVLGPGAFGRFAVPLTLVTLVSLAMTLGGPTVMARYVPAVADADRLAVARSIGRRLAVGRAAQLVAAAAVGAALVVWDRTTFMPLDVGLVLAALVLNVAATLMLQVGLGLGRTSAWSLRYPLQNTVLIVAVLGLHDVAGYTGGVVAVVVAGAAGFAFAAVAVGRDLRAPVGRVAMPAGALNFGRHQAVGAALVQVTHRGGVVLVAVLGSSTVETGYAALATGITLGLTYAVLQTFTVSLTHVAAGSIPDAEAMLRRIAVVLFAVAAVGTLPAALVLDELVLVIFGASYAGAAGALGPALAAIVLAPLSALMVQVAALRMRPHVVAAAGLASLMVFLLCGVLLVADGGATGATTAVLAGVAAGSVTAMILLPRAAGGWLGVGSFAAAGLVLGAALVG